MAARPVTVRNGVLALVLVAAGASPAIAQSTVDTFADLSQVVKKGSVVFVQDEKGERTKGKILQLSDSSLVLQHGIFDRTRVYTADRVMRVSKVDSRRNGFWIGAAVGLGPGLLLGKGMKSWCHNESGSDCWRQYFYVAGPLSLLGGGIGVWIDGMIDGQTLVFSRRGSRTPQVRVAPMLDTHVKGAQLSLRF